MIDLTKSLTYSLFLKIAEPRVFRLLQFVIYIALLVAGVGVLINTPDNIQEVLGNFLIYVFGGFVALGAILGAVAVLPGVWWLERVGLLALGTGFLMYIVIVISLGASVVSVIVYVAFVLTFIQRWTEIRGAYLAPRKD